MKIERIDEKTVKCFLSNEELEEYDIDYKDFVLRSDKAREMLKEIIEHAEAEVGYKAPQFAFDLQIMMVPDQGMVLTFSEKEPFEGREGEQILEYLKEMKNVLKRAQEKLALPGGSQEAKGSVPPAGEEQAQPGKEQTSKRPDFAVFAFEDMRTVMNFAAAVPPGLRILSSLYKMDDLFFLYIRKGTASYEKYSKTCVQALEFGSLYSAEERAVTLLTEHGDCLIEEKALKKLKISGKGI